MNSRVVLTSCSGKLNYVHMGISFIYRKLFLEACLVFNFWTFGAVLYLSFGQFLLNKSPNFYDFFSLLFKSVFYSKQSSIEEFTVIDKLQHQMNITEKFLGYFYFVLTTIILVFLNSGNQMKQIKLGRGKNK